MLFYVMCCIDLELVKYLFYTDFGKLWLQLAKYLYYKEDVIGFQRELCAIITFL